MSSARAGVRLDRHHTLQRTVVATQRPWITAGVKASGIRFFPEGGLSQQFKVTLKNVGNSVATFVENDLKLVASNEDRDLAFQRQNELCNGLRSRLEQSKSKTALFPSEQGVPFYSLSLTAKTITREALGTPPRLLDLALVGCVAYRSEFAEDTHETGYIFWVRQKTPALPLSGTLIEVGKHSKGGTRIVWRKHLCSLTLLPVA